MILYDAILSILADLTKLLQTNYHFLSPLRPMSSPLTHFFHALGLPVGRPGNISHGDVNLSAIRVRMISSVTQNIHLQLTTSWLTGFYNICNYCLPFLFIINSFNVLYSPFCFRILLKITILRRKINNFFQGFLSPSL